jgi:hypothetical protein
MLPLGSVKGPKRLLAWFAESLEGAGLGYRTLPIKSSEGSAVVPLNLQIVGFKRPKPYV